MPGDAVTISSSILARIAGALGLEPGALGPLRAVGGGSINEAGRLETARGPVFVKWHAAPPAGFFEAEADGLARLRPHLPVPDVLAVFADALVLSWCEPWPGRAPSASHADAGRALARLHQVAGPHFGLERENFVGLVPQSNVPVTPPTFAAFFRERRLAPLAEGLPTRLRAALDRLPLEALLTEPPHPALVHGDLWAGNLLHARSGPVFIDPAVHYGHPEADLAMTRLFGGFPPEFYAAYAEGSAGRTRFDAALEARLEVLNLYPLLVHVRLFGASYLGQVEAVLRRYAPGGLGAGR